MSSTLGPRDEARFESVDSAEQEYLAFQIDFCLTILEQRPEQPEALNSAANALTALGYYEDGLELDRRLAGLFPDDPTVLYNLACSLSLTGHLDEATDTLETCIELGYRAFDHMARDPDLANLRQHERFRSLLGRKTVAQ